MTQADSVRAKFAKGELVIGGHIFSSDAQFSELMGYHGYEFVWIDFEHSTFNLTDVLHHVTACAASGTASFVRVAWNDPVQIKRVLEIGPDGLIVPFVCTAQEAKAALDACRYPLKGIRGFGPRRADRFGAISKDDYVHNADKNLLKIMQIEHKTAVENLDAILEVPGIDMIVVGPNDLSASYGHLLELRHPDMIKIYDEIAVKCKAHNMPFGVSIGAQSKITIDEWIARGVSFIGCGDDLGFVAAGAIEIIKYIRKGNAK